MREQLPGPCGRSGVKCRGDAQRGCSWWGRRERAGRSLLQPLLRAPASECFALGAIQGKHCPRCSQAAPAPRKRVPHRLSPLSRLAPGELSVPQAPSDHCTALTSLPVAMAEAGCPKHDPSAPSPAGQEMKVLWSISATEQKQPEQEPQPGDRRATRPRRRLRLPRGLLMGKRGPISQGCKADLCLLSYFWAAELWAETLRSRGHLKCLSRCLEEAESLREALSRGRNGPRGSWPGGAVGAIKGASRPRCRGARCCRRGGCDVWGEERGRVEPWPWKTS